MRIRDMGLSTLDLGERVFFTHRATSVKAQGKGHTRFSGEPRDLSKSDTWRQYHEKPGPHADHQFRHPANGWPAPYRAQPGWKGSENPVRMDRWVVVWPERGVGRIVGLTYRQEGRIHLYGYDDGGNTFDEFGRLPLYEVRSHMNGATMLVPPFACVPLDEHVATSGDNLPLVFGLEGEPERVRGLEWDDYVEHRLATDLGVRERRVAIHG